jgi:pyruvate dehydrogenase E2 component (dihydrolipoamide acetyltransferase)
MATKIFMEALSPTMEEGRLVKWLKNEGDAVKTGDILAEVETDKAIMELVARGDGVLRKRLVNEGDAKPVGTLVGVIAAAGEDVEALIAGSGTGEAGSGKREAGGAAPAPAAQPVVAAPAPAAQPVAASPAPAPVVVAGPPSGSEPPRSSPLARRLASERGLDLTHVQGTGPGGRVIKRDIDTAGAAPLPIAPIPDSRSPLPASRSPLPAFEDIPLTQIRKTIAKRLAESQGPIPTFYLTSEIDVERVAEMRAAMAAEGDAFKVSFNDIILKAVATALSQHRECNAHWLGDKIRYFNSVHIGVAVAVEDGLITPVIFDANRKSLREISAESKDLAARARARRLKPEEYTGSSFSVSNLGMFGIDQFTAIINPPEAGILAIGAVEDKPVVVAGAVTVRKRLRVTMSCDHRVIDGATGARFLQTLTRLLENPLMMVF